MTRESESAIESPICLNCDGPMPSIEYPVRALFCSEVCKQTAKAIRYARARNADGTYNQPDIADAIKIKIGSVLGGGYPESERRLLPTVRAAIFERDGGQCMSCGKPATEIDHMKPQHGTKTNDPDNLQSLCRDCHVEKTLASSRPLKDDEEEQLMAILLRIESPEPVRLCDGAEWNGSYRAFQKRRKEASLEW
jgi:hypothetical protein